MQTVKLTILSLLFVIFLPVVCQAETTPDTWNKEKVYSSIDNHESVVSSIISILLSKDGELATDCTHNTYDKKSYFRLFIHPKYDKAYPPIDNSTVKVCFTPLPDRSDVITYYVYALRKIII